MAVHHKRNVQGFSEALPEIEYELNTIHKSVQISNTLNMKVLVANFCVEVFDFLCHAINWYQSRWIKFRASLNENFYDDKIKRKVDLIRQALARIRLNAEQATQSRVQSVEECVSGISKQLKNVSDRTRDIHRDLPAMLAKVASELFSKVGQQAIQTMLAAGQKVMHGSSNICRIDGK
jgi:hypothetical protein